jgi:hypothetical protein
MKAVLMSGLEGPSRFSLLGIISGLMVSENLGDVHDEIDHLCDLVGIPRREGNFLEGWTSTDWVTVGKEPDDE